MRIVGAIIDNPYDNSKLCEVLSCNKPDDQANKSECDEQASRSYGSKNASSLKFNLVILRGFFEG